MKGGELDFAAGGLVVVIRVLKSHSVRIRRCSMAEHVDERRRQATGGARARITAASLLPPPNPNMHLEQET